MSTASKLPDTGGGPPQPPGWGERLIVAFAVVLAVGMLVYHLPSSPWPPPVASSGQNTLATAAEADAAGDVDRQRSILKALAKKGEARAQYQLGRTYELGTVKDKPDLLAASRWYEKAAGQGYIPAKARLGHLYLEGVGVMQDFKKARRYLYPATDAGNEQAQFDLARMWQQGLGGEKNAAMAYAYYEFAARQDFEPAIKARDKLVASLGPDEISEGQSMLKKLEDQVATGAGQSQTHADAGNATEKRP